MDFESSGCVFESRRGRFFMSRKRSHLRLLRMLSKGIECNSAGSIWAHRASDVRGSLLWLHIEGEKGIQSDAKMVTLVVTTAVHIPTEAAKHN